MAFNLFGPATKCDIRVGYISTDRGLVDGVSVYEANKHAKLNPGTQFIFRNREKILYLNINEVNKLKPEDMLPSNNAADGCGGVVGLNLEGNTRQSTDETVGSLEANAQGGSTQLLTPEQLDVDSTRVHFYGGGGVGVQANPIIGNDGSLLAIDLVHGGFGYQYPPIVNVEDDKGVGSGAVIRSYVGGGTSILEEYDDLEDFEEYDTITCAPTEVGYGQRYGPDGKDLGPWDPGAYIGKAADPLALEIDRYQKQLTSLKPGTKVDIKSGRILEWWTTRHTPPLKITSPDKTSREKHDVQHHAWGGNAEITGYASAAGAPPPPMAENFMEVPFTIRMSGGDNYGLKFNFISENGTHRFSIVADDYKGDKEHKLHKIKIKVQRNTTYNVTSVRAAGKGLVEQGLLKPSAFGNRGVVQAEGSSSSIFTDVVGSRDDDDDLQIQASLGIFKAGKKSKTLHQNRDTFELTYRLEDSSAYKAPPVPRTDKTKPITKYTINDSFMNRFAISPVPPSNVKGSDNAGKTYTFEWEENFPWEGDYIFKGQRDNLAKLYIDQKFISDLDHWNSGPKSIKQHMSPGVHKITVDLLNVPVMKKVKKMIGDTEDSSGGDGIDIVYVGLNAANKPIRVVDGGKRIELKDSHGNDTNCSFNITSGELKFSSNGRKIEGSGKATIVLDWNDKPGTAGVAVGSIKIGKTTWTQEGRSGNESHVITIDPPEESVISVSELNQLEKIGTIFNTVDWINKANRQLWKINSAPGRNDGNFINRYGVLPFDPTPVAKIQKKVEKEVLFKPKKPLVKMVKEGEITYLKVIGDGRVKVNFELNVNDIWNYKGIALREVRIKSDDGEVHLERREGVRRDLQRGSGIFTSGEQYPIKVLGGTKGSGYKTVDSTTLAMDDDVIGGFDTNATLKITGVNVLEEKRTITTTESAYPPGPNASTSEYAGFHEIVWNNIKFPKDGNYAISTMVDDNVVLTFSRTGSPDIVVTKEGFFRRGDGTTSTGKSVDVKFFKAGSYTLKAVLEQIPGRALAAGNPMALAVDIQVQSIQVDEEVVSALSWNENPMGIALVIDAPMPPRPVQPVPEQEGRCPNNPIWSTRMPPTFPSEKKWWPVKHGAWGKFMNRYSISPIPPLSLKGTDGSGIVWRNKWTIDLPYRGFYGIQGTVDNFGKFIIDGREIIKQFDHFKNQSPEKIMVMLEKGKHEIVIELKNEETFVWTTIDKTIFHTADWASSQSQTSEMVDGPKNVDVTFKTTSAADFANGITIDGILSESKTYKGPQINRTVTKSVETGKTYNVTFTSSNKRKVTTGTGIGIQYIGLNPSNNPIRVKQNNTRVELKDGDRGDTNGAFTIDNVLGGTASFSSDGKSINVKGKNVSVTLTYSYNDKPRNSGKAVDSIKIGNTTWTQKHQQIGSETHTVILAEGMTTSGGNLDSNIKLRNRGKNIVEMEEWTDNDWQDIVCSATEGEFYDFEGNRCKFKVPPTNQTVIKYGKGMTSGSKKNGVTYEGPAVATYRSGELGPYLTPSFTTTEDYRENYQDKTWTLTWNNVDFPETGNYDIRAAADNIATIKVDGVEVLKAEVPLIWESGSNLPPHPDVVYSSPRIIKGKRTVQIVLYNGPGQPSSTFWTNPTYVNAKITKKVNVRETDPKSGTAFSKPWTVNPVGVSAVLIPPPCPKLIDGVGIVTDVTVIDPGNGYTAPPPQPPPAGPPSYPVQLELDEIIPTDEGINYGPGDLVCIETPGGGEICYEPEFGNYGQITKVSVPGPVVGEPARPIVGEPARPSGYTSYPNIRVKTQDPKVPTGIGADFIAKLAPRRTPPLADPNTLIQVTDLVGLKQTGYYDGKPYYGAVFYKDGSRYAGFFETAGELVQIYDTMQESIDAMVTTPPSAIQRAGTDINSNNPRLNLPNTPDNLT